MLATIKNSELNNNFKSGLKALKKSDKAKINISDKIDLNGSIDIDNSFKSKYPNDSRWDYLVVYNKKQGYFIEIHPAHTSEIKVILKKKQWLRNRIIKKYFRVIQENNYKIVWISSGKNAILKSSKEYKQLAKESLLPIKNLYIKD